MIAPRKDAFVERERALENEFFFKLDKKLLEDIRKEASNEKAKMALAMAGHISSEVLLDELVQLGVKPESLAAIRLIPMVLVTWANHDVSENERLTVLRAAGEEGVRPDGAASSLLEHWLRTEPQPELEDAWRRYTRELLGTLTADARLKLREEIMARARAVARSARGLLGFGRIGPDEKRVLDSLEDVFDQP